MSGIVGSRLNTRGAGTTGKLGSDGQVLTSAGAGKSIVFEAAPSGGGDLSFGGDTFEEAKTIGSNDSYSLSFETAGNTAMTVDESGATARPLQPAFLAVPAAAQDNMASSAYVTTVLGTEVFDTGGDFTGNTFTAPVAGKYFLCANLTVAAIDHDATFYTQVAIQTSNKYNSENWSVQNFLDAEPDSFTYQLSGTFQLDASDTAYMTYRTTGPGAAQEDVYDSGNVEFTNFGGILMV